MQRLLAITWLTWKAAFRFRLFLVIAVLLLLSVVGLPVLIKDDGTARGFTQILLTYTLSTITALLGLSTLWLACGTLARDIEECQMQVVAVKPVARWQIWLGKWLGIVTLDAALLALSGASVYALLQWRATRLPPKEQHVLRNEVLVSRGAAHPRNFEREIEQETERQVQAKLKANPGLRSDLAEVRHQIRESLKAGLQVVPPGQGKGWKINLGLAKNHLHGQPLYIRAKFNSAEKSPSGTFVGIWAVGDPNTKHYWESGPKSLAPDTYHEFEIPPDLFDEDGTLTIIFGNMNNTTLLFPLKDGMEVLYREGSFAMNYVRALGIILCWMGLLAALGLTASSFLSFPVAAFFSLAMLTMALSSGSLSSAISEGTLLGADAQTGRLNHPVLDAIMIPVFQGMLAVINMAKDYSPIDALSSGRSIPWLVLLRAIGSIVLVLGGIIGGIGIVCFTRRELATAQGTQ